MNAPLSPAIFLDSIKQERLKRAAERSLIEFTKQAFHIIEPGVEFKDNWHLHAIADHLEAVSEGEIENLLINIPPGCMKSILVSVAWPAWEWINRPNLRYLGASYGGDLAIRDAMKCRDIITSDWYRSRWPGIDIKKGSDQKLKYELTSGGWRMATSVGGRATGEHPDRKIVDDPHNAKQAESETERKGAIDWFDRTLSSRGQSRGARTVVVMQRLNELDVSGHIISEQFGYEHLCIPMRYETPRNGEKKKVSVLGWSDPRSVEGALLWPDLFPEKSVQKLEKLLGSYGTAGQLQQRPAPEGGGILKVGHFQLWKDPNLPVLDHIVQSYDGAYTEKTTNDPTACTVWGCFEDPEGRRAGLLLDAWSEHIAYPQLRKRLIKDWTIPYGAKDGDDAKKIKPRKGRRADIVLIENKSSGISLKMDLRASNIPVHSYDPGKADKVSRAHNAAPVLELDVLYVLESTAEPGKPITWARDFIDQCEKFPNAAHDDYVDTFTQAVIYLRDNNWIDMPDPDEDEDDDDEGVDVKKKRANPYSQ